MCFIGKDEKHQLVLIRDYLKFKSSQIYIRDPLAINFIDELLTLDPQQRMNVDKAVKSTFLQPKPSSEVLKLLLNEPFRNTMPNLPHEPIY